MIIDFEKIPEAHLTGFKGGEGHLDTRNYVDGHVKIMYSTLRPGASSGLHTHVGNSEIIFVISGTLTFHYDDRDWRSAAQVSAIIVQWATATTWRTLPITMRCISLLCPNTVSNCKTL